MRFLPCVVRCADRGASNPARPIALFVALVVSLLLVRGASADLLSGDLATDFPTITFTDTPVTSADVSPGAATYDVFFGADSQYVVAAVETTSNYNSGLDFANFYFTTVPGTGSNLGFEVNNQDAFIPVSGGGPAIIGYYDQDGTPNPDVGIRFLNTYSGVPAQAMIEFAIPWTFFTQDPLGLGFTTPTDGVQFRLSQAFGYDFVGGGGSSFDPTFFGTVPVPTPEPASWLLMALGSLGLYAIARRRRRTA